MQPNTLAELPTLLITALLSFLGGYFLVLLQQKRKIIEYDVVSMPLLRFRPKKDGPLTVLVDRFVLTGDEAHKGEPVHVDKAYRFDVELQNVGNEHIDEPNIRIRLDKSATIVEYETRPRSEPGYPIEAHRDHEHANILRVVPPYINKRKKIRISVTSTGNVNQECQLTVFGPGVQVHSRWATRRFVIWGVVFMVVRHGSNRGQTA